MKKASKPVSKTPAKEAPATKPAAAKPKARPAAKPKPREPQDQLELFPILKRLALAAERLAMATAPQPPAAAQEETAGQGQAAVLSIVERLMQSAVKLAQAADRLAQAAERLADAMVDENYRRTGLGKYIATELVPQTAQAFLLSRGIDHARIIVGGEINDVRKLTFEEALSDIEKTELMPNARRAFWENCGYKPLDWPDYVQLKLRKDLESLQRLIFSSRVGTSLKYPRNWSSSSWIIMQSFASISSRGWMRAIVASLGE